MIFVSTTFSSPSGLTETAGSFSKPYTRTSSSVISALPSKSCLYDGGIIDKISPLSLTLQPRFERIVIKGRTSTKGNQKNCR